MTKRFWMPGLVLTAVFFSPASAQEPSPAARGKKALEERAFTPAMWLASAYDNAWRSWGVKEAPKDYAQAFRDRYGLHPAPYPKGELPMGLRHGTNLFGKGLTTDCMLCHGSSIFGKSYIGLGNSSLDVQAFFEELGKASGTGGKTPFPFSNARGTSEAGSMAVYLFSFRDADLRLRTPPHDLELRHNLCEDVPAWWLLKKKKTMYHTGGGHARSVRSLMQFMLVPTVTLETLKKEEATFADIFAYLMTLQPPKYPFAIDKNLASQGEKLFLKSCAKCHGTYGDEWTYPNKIVPLKDIGTDRTRFDGISAKFGAHYNKTWFAKDKDGKASYPATLTAGYQAPPLDGVWATAPYFHNGSAPTLYDVLHSKTRPKIFTRSFRTGMEDYDRVKIGWKIQVLERGADPALPAYQRRKVYDTSQPGRGNAGHTFGDHFTQDQRRAVIEYLKTL